MAVGSARISALLGTAAAEVVSDAELASRLGLTSEEVRERSRGLLRTSAPDGDGPAAMAAPVTESLLAGLGVLASELSMIVFATTTPDITFPGSACLLQARLGVAGNACLDVRSQCTGFLAALDVAQKFVASGTYGRVLVAAADVPTHIVRYDGQEADLAILTGDGAAVALVEPGPGRGEILASRMLLDGSRFEEFWCEFPASRHLGHRGVARGERMMPAAYFDGRIYPRVDLDRMRATAIERMPSVFDEVLTQAGMDGVDVTILAHLDPGVEDAVAASLSGRGGRILRRRMAYSFGSALPVALAEAGENGQIEEGETVALLTSGAGATWGATVLRW